MYMKASYPLFRLWFSLPENKSSNALRVKQKKFLKLFITQVNDSEDYPSQLSYYEGAMWSSFRSTFGWDARPMHYAPPPPPFCEIALTIY